MMGFIQGESNVYADEINDKEAGQLILFINLNVFPMEI